MKNKDMLAKQKIWGYLLFFLLISFGIVFLAFLFTNYEFSKGFYSARIDKSVTLYLLSAIAQSFAAVVSIVIVVFIFSLQVLTSRYSLPFLGIKHIVRDSYLIPFLLFFFLYISFNFWLFPAVQVEADWLYIYLDLIYGLLSFGFLVCYLPYLFSYLSIDKILVSLENHFEREVAKEKGTSAGILEAVKEKGRGVEILKALSRIAVSSISRKDFVELFSCFDAYEAMFGVCAERRSISIGQATVKELTDVMDFIGEVPRGALNLALWRFGQTMGRILFVITKAELTEAKFPPVGGFFFLLVTKMGPYFPFPKGEKKEETERYVFKALVNGFLERVLLSWGDDKDKLKAKMDWLLTECVKPEIAQIWSIRFFQAVAVTLKEEIVNPSTERSRRATLGRIFSNYFLFCQQNFHRFGGRLTKDAWLALDVLLTFKLTSGDLEIIKIILMDIRYELDELLEVIQKADSGLFGEIHGLRQEVRQKLKGIGDGTLQI